MRSNSSYKMRFQQYLRPAWEIRSAALWGASSAYTLLLTGNGLFDKTVGLALFSGFAAFSLMRLNQGLKVVFRKANLSGKKLSLHPIHALAQKMVEGKIYIGEGFNWEPEHTQMLHELSKINPNKYRLKGWQLALIGKKEEAQSDNEIGLPFIHGVGDKEEAIQFPIKVFEGGTCILGTTQAGKGVLLTSLILKAV